MLQLERSFFRHQRRLYAATAVLVGTLLVGCERPSDVGYSPRSASSPLALHPLWSLDEEAGLYRVHSGFIDRDGPIFLAHGGQNQVLAYAQSGELIHAFGGAGQGPGEFIQLAWIQRFGGDSLIAYDRYAKHAVVLSRDGHPGRISRTPFVAGEGQDLRIFLTTPEGNFVLGYTSNLDPRQIPDPIQDTLAMVHVDVGTETRTTVARVPDRWWVGGQQGAAATLNALDERGFALIAFDGVERMALGHSTEGVISVVPFMSFAANPLTFRPLDGTPFSEISQVIFEWESDRLWVRPDQSSIGSDSWIIWDVERNAQWHASLPAGSRILDVAHGRVLTSRTDAQGVQIVSLWAIGNNN